MELHLEPKIAHILGPLWINSYGLAMAISITFFFFLSSRDPRVKQLGLDLEKYIEMLFFGIISGVIGSRFFHILQELNYFKLNPLAVFKVWDGGLSMLGGLIFVPVTIIYILRNSKIPILKFFDLVCTYAPIIEAVTRFGCLASGCCYGAPVAANSFLSIIYTNPNSLAPVGIPLCPAQIYASIASFATLLVLYLISKLKPYPGTILSLFFAFSGFTRFALDFIRGERGELLGLISWYQYLALAMALSGIIGFSFIVVFNRYREQH
jgi:phosphatidylglycerol---prolipoprotein diacylglyceryl transferase